MYKKIIIIPLVLLACCCSCCNAKRFLSNRGKEFHVGALPSTGDFACGIQLVYYSENKVNVTTTYFDQQQNAETTNTTAVPSNDAESLTVPIASVLNGKAIKVLGMEEFITIASISFNGGTGYYLAIPSHEILCEEYQYFVLSATSDDMGRTAGVLIIGARDITRVNISFSANVPVVFNSSATLYSGESIFIDAADITGMKIVSDKPLTVISGHEAGSVPSDGTLEPMAQQIPPTQLWGEKFMIAPFIYSAPRQIIKVLSSVNNTEIAYNCHQFSNQTVLLQEAGSVHQFLVPSNVYCYIEANDSVIVGQFPYSPNGNTDGDTTMILVASTDQYSNKFNFWIPGTANNYVSITVPANHYNNNDILYDGLPINCTDEWKPINDKYNETTVGYGCSIAVSEGVHNVSHRDNDGRLFVTVYGFSTSRAYGYPAGLTFDSSKVLGVRFSREEYITAVQQHGSNVEIQLVRTKEWKQPAEFVLTVYTSTTKEVYYTAPVAMYPDNSTILLCVEVDLQKSNYDVELCCVDETAYDVCVHAKVSGVNSMDNVSLASINKTPLVSKLSSMMGSTVIMETSRAMLSQSFSSTANQETAAKQTTFVASLTTSSVMSTSASSIISTQNSLVFSEEMATFSSPSLTSLLALMSSIEDVVQFVTSETTIHNTLSTFPVSEVTLTSKQTMTKTTLMPSSIRGQENTTAATRITSSSKEKTTLTAFTSNMLPTESAVQLSFISPSLLTMTDKEGTRSSTHQSSNLPLRDHPIISSTSTSSVVVALIRNSSTPLAQTTLPRGLNTNSTVVSRHQSSSSGTFTPDPIGLSEMQDPSSTVLVISLSAGIVIALLIAVISSVIFGMYCYTRGKKRGMMDITKEDWSVRMLNVSKKNKDENELETDFPITYESFNIQPDNQQPAEANERNSDISEVSLVAVGDEQETIPSHSREKNVTELSTSDVTDEQASDIKEGLSSKFSIPLGVSNPLFLHSQKNGRVTDESSL